MARGGTGKRGQMGTDRNRLHGEQDQGGRRCMGWVIKTVLVSIKR